MRKRRLDHILMIGFDNNWNEVGREKARVIGPGGKWVRPKHIRSYLRMMGATTVIRENVWRAA